MSSLKVESGVRSMLQRANAVRNHQVDGVARALLVVERFGKDGIGI